MALRKSLTYLINYLLTELLGALFNLKMDSHVVAFSSWMYSAKFDNVVTTQTKGMLRQQLSVAVVTCSIIVVRSLFQLGAVFSVMS